MTDIFVIGNGPSLNRYDLNRLAGRHTFVCNRFYLYKGLTWTPTYYTAADEGVLLDYWDEVMDYAKKAERSFFPAVHPQGIDVKTLVDLPNVTFYELAWGGFFMNDGFKVGLNGTVANVMIQLAYEMGYKNIYLLGVDMSYTVNGSMTLDSNGRDMYSHGDDPNHFDPNYFGAGHHFHYPKVDLMIERLGKLARLLDDRGVKVYNLNPDSKFRNCLFADFEKVVG